MNAEQLQEIKGRVEKATLGPWKWEVDRFGCEELYSANDDEIITAGCGQNVGFVRIKENNAEFIARARENIPTLIAEVERLREALDNAAGYISIGESAKANDIICRALGIDINHYGIYGEEEAE